MTSDKKVHVHCNAKQGVFSIMAIRGVEFSNGGTKLEKNLPKNQHPHRKLLNFENWALVA